MVPVFFAYFSVVSVLAGVLTVTLRNPVHCGLALLTLLLHVAGLFVLLNLKSEERYVHTKYAVILFAAVGVLGEVVLLMLASPFGGSKGDAPTGTLVNVGGSYAVGIKMFSDYLLQFEIVGVFLLGAIIGAIVLAKTPAGSDAEQQGR